MEYNETNIELLLPRYCEGIATVEEQRLVKDWMKESEENRRIVKQMEIVYLVEHDGGKDAGVQMLEARTNPGMTTSVVLPDSTVVFLNSESSLRYPSSFKNSKERKVELKGEGYFEVTKDVEKHFIVSTVHRSQVEVLGTSFNIEAYEESPEVSTTLIKGKVNFSFQEGVRKKQIVLNPGQKVVYDSKKGTARLLETSGETETSWKDGKIIFDNTSLKDALRILEKRYNVVFIQKNPARKAAFTGTFTSQRLERILEYFKLSSNIHWKYVDGKDASQKKTHIEIY